MARPNAQNKVEEEIVEPVEEVATEEIVEPVEEDQLGETVVEEFNEVEVEVEEDRDLSPRELVQQAMDAERVAEKAEEAAESAKETDLEEITRVEAERARFVAESLNRAAMAAQRRNRPNAPRNPVADRMRQLSRIAEGLEEGDALPDDLAGLREYALQQRREVAALSVQVDQQSKELAAARPIVQRSEKVEQVLRQTARNNKSRWKILEGSIDEDGVDVQVRILPYRFKRGSDKANGLTDCAVAIYERQEDETLRVVGFYKDEMNLTDMGDTYRTSS